MTRRLPPWKVGDFVRLVRLTRWDPDLGFERDDVGVVLEPVVEGSEPEGQIVLVTVPGYVGITGCSTMGFDRAALVPCTVDEFLGCRGAGGGVWGPTKPATSPRPRLGRVVDGLRVYDGGRKNLSEGSR